MSDPSDLFNQGVACLNNGDAKGAVDAFEAALALRDDMIPIWVNLGVARLKTGDAKGAVAALEKALALNPHNPGALANLASALMEADRHKEALKAAETAVKFAPTSADVTVILGHAHLALGSLEAAQKTYAKAVELAPARGDLFTHLAEALRHQGCWDDALAVYDRARTLNPEDREARLGQGLVHLTLGNWKQGLELYESRTSKSGDRNAALFANRPRWQGDALARRTLLVAWEQGFGDTVMFARFLHHPILAGEAVTFVCQPALVDLMARSFPNLTVISSDDPPPPSDLWVPLASLPYVLKARPDDLPPPVLAPPEEKPSLPGTFKIGLAWTSANAGRKVLKTVGLSAFRALQGVEADFFSLQWGEGHHLPDWIENIDPLLDGFAATAAVLSQLDLVISVDTVTAHMAASLGVPTWIVLPKVSDWRWGEGAETSPWYPTARLFRQDSQGSWTGVMARLSAAAAQAANNS